MDTNTAKTVYTDEEARCLLNRVADKWTALVIGLLEGGPKRFTVLRREIEGITQKMLTQTLRELERNGVVERKVFAQVPPRVEYTLTPLGRSLCEPLTAIRQWAEAHKSEVAKAREQYDAKLAAKEE